MFFCGDEIYIVVPFAGKRYVLKQDQPTCLPCYEEKFANRCEKCEKAIGTDFKVRSSDGTLWWWTLVGAVAVLLLR